MLTPNFTKNMLARYFEGMKYYEDVFVKTHSMDIPLDITTSSEYHAWEMGFNIARSNHWENMGWSPELINQFFPPLGEGNEKGNISI